MADDKMQAGKRGAAISMPVAAKPKAKVRIDASPVAMMTAAPAAPVPAVVAALPPLVTPKAPPLVTPKAPPVVVPAAATVAAVSAAPLPVAPASAPIVAAPAPTPPAPAPAPLTVPAPAAVPPAPVAAAPAPIPAPAPKKDVPMNETINEMSANAANTIKTGTETAYANGKAALDQVTTKSKEAIEHGMKSLDDMTTMARGNVEALLASTRAATTGLETIAHQVADFSRKHFEETTAAARAMTTVKTPNELMQLQNDFAKTQFDAAINEMSKLSETLVKLAGEVFEPMQNRVALATDKLKSAATTTFNA